MNKYDIKIISYTLSIYMFFIFCVSVIIGLILSLSISHIFKIDFDQDLLNLWTLRSIIVITAILLIKHFISKYKYYKSTNRYYL